MFSENIMSEKLAEEKRTAHAGVQRNTLIREVNHRIKNNIQSVIGLLRYQMRQKLVSFGDDFWIENQDGQKARVSS